MTPVAGLRDKASLRDDCGVRGYAINRTLRDDIIVILLINSVHAYKNKQETRLQSDVIYL